MLFLFLSLPSYSFAQEVNTTEGETNLTTFKIGIVRDGDSPYFNSVIKGFEAELRELSKDRYLFEFIDTYNAQYNPLEVKATLERALSNPELHCIYAAGLVVTHIASQLEEGQRRIPILGGAIDVVGLNSEHISSRGGSNIKNYTFIQSPWRIEADLEMISKLTGQKKILAIVDGFAHQALQEQFSPKVLSLSQKLDLEIQTVPRKDTTQETLAQIPPETQAVYIPLLPSATLKEREELYSELTKKGLLTLSIHGLPDVERGVFAGLSGDVRPALYRRIAVNLHQILQGVSTDTLPVTLIANDRLVINLKTARALGWSPDYDTSLSARFLHEEELQGDAPELSLEMAMSISRHLNRNLKATEAETRIQEAQLNRLKGRYWPQLDIQGQAASFGTTDRINPLTTPHHGRELSLGVQIRQLLFSDQLISQIRAQKRAVESFKFQEESIRLDAMEQAGLAFLDVLAAEALYKIEKENLQLIENNLRLAKLRVEIGAAERTEEFRWLASRAQSMSILFQRDSARKNARIALNVILGKPRNAIWRLKDIQLAEDDFYFMSETLKELLTNQRAFFGYIEFLKQEAVERAPELKAFEKSLAAQGILLKERTRRNFLPELSFSASATRVQQAAHQIPKDSENQWSVGLGFIIPLFDAQRSPEIRQIRATQDQLSAQRDQALFLIEQKVLSESYDIAASHPTLRLSRRALEAAEKNHSSVLAKYQQGSASILDLLDAQSELLVQRQSETLAGYEFLKDVISSQRATNWFEFLQSEDEKQAWILRLKNFLTKWNGKGSAK